MSPKYNQIRDYYLKGFWTGVMLENAVIKGWITEQEMADILEAKV